jgi:hypothetical protein
LKVKELQNYFQKMSLDDNFPFLNFSLKTENNLFKEFVKDEYFSVVAKGRKVGILVDSPSGNLVSLLSRASRGVTLTEAIPLIRTTTTYPDPPRLFPDGFYKLIKKIREVSNTRELFPRHQELKFNNAMIELYTPEYKTMSYHSDQALDLASESYICIFSTYSSPDENRILRVQHKETKKITDIKMTVNSIILFSTETNKKYKHKIILDSSSKNKDNQLLGITLRLSKTFVKFEDKVPYLIQEANSKIPLTLATEEEKKEFMKCKGLENSLASYEYPKITYTLSPGDLIQPSF